MRIDDSLLLTDLYQLTMLHGYFERGMEAPATFEFFVRDLPPSRNFLVAAGLEQVLDFLENARFTEDELEWLAQTGRFPAAFIDYLREWRFTGEVHAIPEGTVFFPDEPLLRVTAPIPEAQLVESRIINLLQFQILIASKAVRSRLVAPDKLLVDFGLRRAHGAEAGLLAARASYIAGFDGTATVLAGREFDIPTFGTMAHSYVEAHESEAEAFESFARAQPDNVTLLIDTYDTEAGAEAVVQLAPRLRREGIAIKAVRIDSGDLVEHGKNVRRILDEGGLDEVGIFSSGSLDEFVIRDMLAAGAPIDGFGVGTRLDTSADAPYLDCAYKLTEYDGQPRRKKSERKATLPGRKQVYRQFDDDGVMTGDVITLTDAPEEGEPLLQPVFQGRRVADPVPLQAIAGHLREQLERLPAALKKLDTAHVYPVRVSAALSDLARATDRELEIAS